MQPPEQIAKQLVMLKQHAARIRRIIADLESFRRRLPACRLGSVFIPEPASPSI